jgi:hypothetical protein
MVHDARPASKSATLTSALFQSPCNLQTWSMISWRANFVGSVSRKENYIYICLYIHITSYYKMVINPYKSTILNGRTIQFPWLHLAWLHPGARARQMGHVPPASWSFLAQPKQVLWWHLGGIQKKNLLDPNICNCFFIHRVYVCMSAMPCNAMQCKYVCMYVCNCM